jgi:hypothetical protein
MMDIKEFKEIVLADMDNLVKEEAKRQLVSWLNAKALPTVRDVAEAYCERLKADSEGEQGWCKYRDSIVLPLMITMGISLAEIVLKKVDESV